MNILALDTSMGACSTAVLRQEGEARPVFSRSALMQRGHAEALMPMLAEVMDEAGLSFDDLDVIAATLGPGSFTGVRIAIAAALGLALVIPVKLFGTDSLSVMALTADLAPHGPFAVAVDARRGMLYLATFESDGTRREGPLLVGPDDALNHLPTALNTVIGSGAELIAEAAAQRGRKLEALLPELQPNASALAELALSADKTFSTLRPLYLRPPDARPQAHTLARC